MDDFDFGDVAGGIKAGQQEEKTVSEPEETTASSELIELTPAQKEEQELAKFEETSIPVGNKMKPLAEVTPEEFLSWLQDVMPQSKTPTRLTEARRQKFSDPDSREAIWKGTVTKLRKFYMVDPDEAERRKKRVFELKKKGELPDWELPN